MNREVYPCPLCGRVVNRSGEPFRDESQTLAHIDGAHDSTHSGERSRDYRGTIEPEERAPSDLSGGSGGDEETPPATVMYQHAGFEEPEERPLADAVEANAALLSELIQEPPAFGVASGETVTDTAENVEELQERVDRLETVAQDALDLVEVLMAVVAHEHAEAIDHAEEIRERRPGPVVPYRYESETSEFRVRRYE